MAGEGGVVAAGVAVRRAVRWLEREGLVAGWVSGCLSIKTDGTAPLETTETLELQCFELRIVCHLLQSDSDAEAIFTSLNSGM